MSWSTLRWVVVPILGAFGLGIMALAPYVFEDMRQAMRETHGD